MKNSKEIERPARQLPASGPGAGIVSAALVLAFVACVGTWHAGALAQAYPVKPLRIIVPLAAGGPPDFVARTMAQHLTTGLNALAKAKPGELNFGSGGSGTPLHIAGEMLNTAAGVRLVHVPFKGAAAAVIDLITGRIQVMVEQLFPMAQHIQNGRIRPLAVAAAKRHPQLPDLPTAAEAGLPGYEVIAWMGLVAPRGTPADVVKRLNAEAVKALQTKEVRDGLFNQGLQPAGNSPEEFSAFIAAESARWSRAVKTSGAKVD